MQQTYHLVLTINYTDGTENEIGYNGLTWLETQGTINEALTRYNVSSVVASIAKH